VTVIVVDDGSTDNTSTIAEAAGALVLRHIKNMGKGEALNTGIIEARMMNPDAVVVIDGDGQHLAGELPRLVYPILEDEADIVVGSRYLEKTSDVPNHRVLGHRFFNRLTGMASRINVSDSQSGYRAFSPKAFKTDLFQSAGFSVESEMQFIAHEHNLRVVEVPITIRYTDKPKRPVIQQGVIVLNGILHLIGQYRPLLFFGLPGLIIILTGFGLGFLVINIYGRTKVLAVGYAMISVLLTVSGMVLFSTGIILHSIRGLLFEMLREKGHASVK
jgi:glycosyltransferase involved in cell wall biosynthesis